MKSARRLLIINVESPGIDFLRHNLEERRIQVTTVDRNSEGLEKALREEPPPDVILIGNTPASPVDCEIYRKLQENAQAARKPILFAVPLENGGPHAAATIDIEKTLNRLQEHLSLLDAVEENEDLKARLDESRSTASLGVASLAITHNINNFLGVVVGYMELLKMSCDRPEKVLEFHRAIEEAHDKIITTIQNLTEMGHNSRQYPRAPVDLEDFFVKVIKRLHRKIGVAPPVDVSFMDPCRQLCTHAEVLENILIEALTNAWESYQEVRHNERFISIVVRKETHGPGPEASTLIINVTDRGTGLNGSISNDPFAPFATTKEGTGAGMGLTAARYSIRRLGGELTLRENCEGGVTAEIRHPL